MSDQGSEIPSYTEAPAPSTPELGVRMGGDVASRWGRSWSHLEPRASYTHTRADHKIARVSTSTAPNSTTASAAAYPIAQKRSPADPHVSWTAMREAHGLPRSL
jgi:hypothetical protein